jgi:hypothetical protein
MLTADLTGSFSRNDEVEPLHSATSRSSTSYELVHDQVLGKRRLQPERTPVQQHPSIQLL